MDHVKFLECMQIIEAALQSEATPTTSDKPSGSSLSVSKALKFIIKCYDADHSSPASASSTASTSTDFEIAAREEMTTPDGWDHFVGGLSSYIMNMQNENTALAWASYIQGICAKDTRLHTEMQICKTRLRQVHLEEVLEKFLDRGTNPQNRSEPMLPQ